MKQYKSRIETVAENEQSIKEEMEGTAKEEDLEEESDDGEDSDYDVLGGDLCLYDSRLDEIDELIFMKETVDVLYQQQNQIYMQMTSSTDVSELANSLG